jgi:lactoylglutathione lyase
MQVNDHTAFQVSNIDEAIEFYTKLLGAKVKLKSINEEEREAYAFLELEGGSLELIQKLGEEYEKPVIRAPFCPHLAIETKDMGRTMGSIREADVKVIRGPLEIEGEERWVYVADPDNNVVEFIEWVSKNRTA